VRVELTAAPDGSWGGLILGSDYLMWGANHQRLTIELANGVEAEVVVRATGRVLGMGQAPHLVIMGGGE